MNKVMFDIRYDIDTEDLIIDYEGTPELLSDVLGTCFGHVLVTNKLPKLKYLFIFIKSFIFCNFKTYR